ncbi:MAG: PLP-dependent aminotransferase family protein [Anaerolineae bacterium]
MSLSLEIDRHNTRPLYQQIVAQIKREISVGNLPPGTRLPPVRQVAETLAINRLTVHAAYSELQAEGWIESTVGRGTFVLKPAEASSLLASVGKQMSANSVLADIHPIKRISTLRSLAYAEPDGRLAPVDEFLGTVGSLRGRADALMMHYDAPQGDEALRVEITALLHERGILATPDDVMITSGGMQGLSLAARALAQPGDAVLVEEPTYLGLVHILEVHGLRPIPIPVTEHGLDMEAVQHALRTEHPRFLYVIPSFQNPSGRSLPLEHHSLLLNLAEQHDFMIIEDDVYGLLSYDSAPLPTLKSCDVHDRVIYISSASKVLMPGLRIGWMLMPQAMTEPVLALRRAMDMCGPAYTQRAMAHFLSGGRMRAHLRRALPVYRARRDTLMQALARHMPADVRWSHPRGGFSAWVTLPHANMNQVYQTALQNNIAFTPGDAFLLRAGNNRHFRLCFGHQDERAIEEIIALLGEIITHHNH